MWRHVEEVSSPDKPDTEGRLVTARALRERPTAGTIREMDGNRPASPPAHVLDELLQVDGVIGGLLVSDDGELLLERLPAAFSGRAACAAPRLAVFLEAFAAGRNTHGFCLRFFEHRLHVLPLPGAFLCVLSELGAVSPILKMAMIVTGRRLS